MSDDGVAICRSFFQLRRCGQHQTGMPYNTGQIPKVGDRIADKYHRHGTVVRIMLSGAATSELIIKWEDGTVGIRYTTPEDFELLDHPIEVTEAHRHLP